MKVRVVELHGGARKAPASQAESAFKKLWQELENQLHGHVKDECLHLAYGPACSNSTSC